MRLKSVDQAHRVLNRIRPALRQSDGEDCSRVVKIEVQGASGTHAPTGGTARSKTNGSPDSATLKLRAGIHGSSLGDLKYQKLEIPQA